MTQERFDKLRVGNSVIIRTWQELEDEGYEIRTSECPEHDFLYFPNYKYLTRSNCKKMFDKWQYQAAKVAEIYEEDSTSVMVSFPGGEIAFIHKEEIY